MGPATIVRHATRLIGCQVDARVADDQINSPPWWRRAPSLAGSFPFFKLNEWGPLTTGGANQATDVRIQLKAISRARDIEMRPIGIGGWAPRRRA